MHATPSLLDAAMRSLQYWITDYATMPRPGGLGADPSLTVKIFSAASVTGPVGPIGYSSVHVLLSALLALSPLSLPLAVSSLPPLLLIFERIQKR